MLHGENDVWHLGGGLDGHGPFAPPPKFALGYKMCFCWWCRICANNDISMTTRRPAPRTKRSTITSVLCVRHEYAWPCDRLITGCSLNSSCTDWPNVSCSKCLYTGLPQLMPLLHWQIRNIFLMGGLAA